MTQSDLQVLPREEDLVHLCKGYSFFLISQSPDRCRILQRLVDAKEKIDLSLSMRITKVVCEMALDAGDQLGSDGEESLLLAKLSMMGNGASILHGYLVTHFIIHARDRFK